MQTNQSLTKAEEQIMQILWKIEKGFVKDIIEHFEEPRPAYNTVSTIVRILEQKGFVDHLAYGKTHEYFPLIQKSEYQKSFLQHFMKNYFDGSFKQLVSFFSKEENLSVKDIEEIMNEIKKK